MREEGQLVLENADVERPELRGFSVYPQSVHPQPGWDQ